MADAPDNVFEIPTFNMDELRNRIAKMNRRAAKLGVPAVEIRELRRFTRRFAREQGSGSYEVPFCVVEVTGQAPKLAGWTFVATLHHTPAGVLIQSVPGREVPVELREVNPGRCDHCHAHRRRNDTFVVQHEDGRVQVVGRQCLADFLGGRDPKAIAAYFQELDRLVKALKSEDELGFCANHVWNFGEPVERYLTLAAMSVREFGWKSRRAAQDEGGLSTAAHAWQLAEGPPSHPSAQAQHAREMALVDWAHDGRTAREAIVYVATEIARKPVADRSEYEHNLLVALSSPITLKSSGFAASALQACHRYQERAAQRRQQAEAAQMSEYLHAPKKRFETEAKVIFERALEGNYGVTHLIKFADAAGNQMTWFASGGQRVHVGDCFKIRATVKKHEEYRGIKQTVITRAVLTPKDEAA